MPPACARRSRQLATTAARSIVRTAARSATSSWAGIGQVVVGHVVAEPGGLALELQDHLADRAVTLLADDDLGQFMDLIHLRLPGHMLRRALAGLLARQVVLVAIDEHHDVGVLLDRAGRR